MQEKSVLTGHLSELKQKIENGLEELKSSKELYEFKSEYLEGKKSKISGLMKEMKNIAPEERANYGKSVNELKEWALGRFQKVEEEMKERELQKKYESEKIDLTLPAECIRTGYDLFRSREEREIHPVCYRAVSWC